LHKGFDLVASAFLVAVVFRAIGGVVAAISTPSLPGTSTGLLGGVPTVLDLSAYERLYYASGWGDLISAMLIVLAAAAVVVPRLIWAGEVELTWPRRARRLITAIVVVAALTAVAAALFIVDALVKPGFPSGLKLTFQDAVTVAEAAGALLVSTAGAVVAWKAFSNWAGESASPGQGGTAPGPYLND
jgi:hypothetical protein